LKLALAELFVVGALISSALTASAAESQSQPKSVTLDVKDADVREVLHAMQQQCGIRNLLIDKEVSGSATLKFTDVPCLTAFRVVTRQFGLAMQFEENSLVEVTVPRR
jgi:type II secretory pathway component HofQ